MGRTSHTRQAWRRRRFLPVFSDKRTVCRGVDDSELLRSVFTQAPDKRPKPGGEPPLLPPRRPSPAQLQPSAHPRRPTLLSLHPSLHPTLLRANSTLTALQRARAMRNLNYIIYFFLFFHDSPPCLRTQSYSSVSVLFLKNYKGKSQNRHAGTKREAENTDVIFF